MARESSAVGAGPGVGGAPPLPGGVLHLGMPPVQKRSTPTFWPHPSGDQLKSATLVRNWAKNDGRNSSCRENVATA